MHQNMSTQNKPKHQYVSTPTKTHFVLGRRVLVLRLVPGRNHLLLTFVPGRHRLLQRFVLGRHVFVLIITRKFQIFKILMVEMCWVRCLKVTLLKCAESEGGRTPISTSRFFPLQFFVKSLKSCPVPCVYHLLSHQNYTAKTFWCINSKRRVGLIPSFIFRCSVNLKRVCSQW
jgi:hypothetical protein